MPESDDLLHSVDNDHIKQWRLYNYFERQYWIESGNMTLIDHSVLS